MPRTIIRHHYYSKRDRGHWLTIDVRRESNLRKSKGRKEDKSWKQTKPGKAEI